LSRKTFCHLPIVSFKLVVENEIFKDKLNNYNLFDYIILDDGRKTLANSANCLVDSDEKLLDRFEQEPKQNFSFSNKTENVKDDMHDAKTLFGALISKKIENSTMNLDFDLPELPKDINDFTWQIPNQSNYEWIDYQDMLAHKMANKENKIDDEGFYSKDVSPKTKSKHFERNNTENANEIWFRALATKSNKCFSWETRHS
jgi:hypothetical protein